MEQKLRIGVPIPHDPPETGGGHELQNLLFSEILQRRIQGCNGKLQYIPIECFPGTAEDWGLAREDLLILDGNIQNTNKSLLSRAFTKFIKPWKLPAKPHAPYTTASLAKIERNIDILWSLNPELITYEVPYIVSIWDLQHRLQPHFPEVSKGGEWDKRELHFKAVTRRAFLNVTGTGRGRDELMQFYGIDRARILVNPFPCPPPIALEEAYCQEIEKKYSLNNKEYLIYPANFWSHKNHLAIVLAFKELKPVLPRLKLVLAGSDKGSKGTVKAINRLISELDLANNIVITGFAPRKELCALYKGAVALAYPSYFGPDNIPPLEAMSYGIVPLVADVPGAREQLGDCAIFFNPSDPSDMAHKISETYKDPTLNASILARGEAKVRRLSAQSYVDLVEEYLCNEMICIQAAALHGAI